MNWPQEVVVKVFVGEKFSKTNVTPRHSLFPKKVNISNASLTPDIKLMTSIGIFT